VANKSLNFIVRLAGATPSAAKTKSPSSRCRASCRAFPHAGRSRAPSRRTFVSISSLIRSHLNDLFPGRQVTEFSQFRVTRHSDLAVDEEEVKNLRTALRWACSSATMARRCGWRCRPVVPSFLSDFLLAAVRPAPEGAVPRARAGQPGAAEPADRPGGCARAAVSSATSPAGRCSSRRAVVLRALQQGDVLIHQPYESFDAVLAFLREAVEDPNVLAIKQTIYRTGAKSELMDLLREAVRRGKEVTAVVELKARFDEEANINYAERLESVGAQVVYGVVGLKTHAKMLLVTRREEGRFALCPPVHRQLQPRHRRGCTPT
jgi:polyphosphate kinase